MTTRTVYVPRLIESAEQAEALPEGTLATHPSLWAREKVEDLWQVEGETYESKHMVGFTALVPIEAEEEWKTLHEGAWHLKADEDDAHRDANSLGARRRYTTDWEEA